MPEHTNNSIEQPTPKNRAVERLSQLSVMQEVETNEQETIDFSRLAPAGNETAQTGEESLEVRGFRFMTEDVFQRLDQNKMFPDPEDERWGDLHSATVLYSAKDDITINVYTRLYLRPEADDETGQHIDFMATNSTTFSLVSQGGSVTTKDHIHNKQREDLDALEGLEVKVDFFKGKFPPTGDSYDTGYESSFSMNPDEAAYLTVNPDEESVQHLGHVEMTSYSNGEAYLHGYLGAMDNAKRIIASDIDTFAGWVQSSEEIEAEA